MTTYRKRGREYYKIDGEKITRVLNMEKRSMIDISDGNWILKSDVLDKDSGIKDSTEAEFSEQYKYAFDRISLQKLDV